MIPLMVAYVDEGTPLWPSMTTPIAPHELSYISRAANHHGRTTHQSTVLLHHTKSTEERIQKDPNENPLSAAPALATFAFLARSTRVDAEEPLVPMIQVPG